MKVYIAGQYPPKYVPDDVWFIHNRRLITYYDVMPKKPLPAFCSNVNTMMDSGAYTAAVTGKKINLGQYLDYMIEHKLKVGIMLDVIGDADKTFKNLQTIKKLNVPFLMLPVLHEEGTTDYHLERMLSFDDPYVALSFVDKGNTKQCYKFVKNCYDKFPCLYDKKVHCLGVFKKEIFQDFPIYSCDTSTAILATIKFGRRTVQMGKVNHVIQIEHYLRQYAKIEKEITALWASRGVFDDNFPIK